MCMYCMSRLCVRRRQNARKSQRRTMEKVSGYAISSASHFFSIFFNTRSLSLHLTRTIIPTCRCSVAGLDDLDLDLGLNTVASFRHSATKSWFPAKILPIFKQTTFDELSLTDLAATNRLRMPKINMFQEKINKYRFVRETNKIDANACARNCESMMMIIKCAERWRWDSAIEISDKRCDKREGEEGIFGLIGSMPNVLPLAKFQL